MPVTTCVRTVKSALKSLPLDLVFWNTGAGWSEAELRIGERTERLSMTHVFNDPNEEIARATVELLDGSKASRFHWLEEPGTKEFFFQRPDQSPRLLLRFRTFGEIYVDAVPDRTAPHVAITVETHLAYWVTLVQTSLARTAALARHSLYSSWNDAQVPHRGLARMEAFLHEQSRRFGKRG